MKTLLTLIVLAGVVGVERAAAADAPPDTRCFELRVYTAAPGKLAALQQRFRDHTCKLFEKHGMTNIGYWVPLDAADQRLVYVLAYPDRAARAKAWGAFMGDKEWQAVWKESEKDGKLVAKVESTFLRPTDYSPAIKPEVAKEPRVFELRTYTTTAGNLARLDSRFRDHTISLFSKHGMGHFGYWWLDKDQKGADNTLIYMLAHQSKEASEASFKAFRDDPAWKEVRAASEKAAGGSLTTPDGVKSLLLTPMDFSLTR